MKIDYMSDNHLDSYVWSNNKANMEKKTLKYLPSLLNEQIGDVLVIAGDLSNSYHQCLIALRYFSSIYKKVFYVLGNHEYYLCGSRENWEFSYNSFIKINKLKEAILEIENVELLDDFNVVEYEGIKFSGSTNWYSLNSYEEKVYYKDNSNDSQMIKKFSISDKNLKESMFYQKLDQVDVVITHVPTIYINSHFKYKNHLCYINEILELKANNYIFGHCHETSKYIKAGCNFYINAIGYREEKKEKKVKSFYV